jgi:serine/threonine-protein kinase
MHGSVENLIEMQHQALLEWTPDNLEYEELYRQIRNKDLRVTISTLHHELVVLLKKMNERLPVQEYSNNHYWADESRELIDVIDISIALVSGLKDTGFSLTIDSYYSDLFGKLQSFLCTSGGSTLPMGMPKIDIYYRNQIFISSDTISVSRQTDVQHYQLKPIGEGSYAEVFKYHDANYNRDIVVKRAKKDLNQKEKARFRREFEIMQELSSPYVVEVYRFNDQQYEYTMEFMDSTLHKFISSNNTKLDPSLRVGLARQIIRGFRYIHSKKLLHRDISPNNILLKRYEDLIVVKLSDFGLVKVEESTLTSLDTGFKGSFNDPALRIIGFNNYTMAHEMYALTLLLYFVLTGKKNINLISDSNLKDFVEKGVSSDVSARYSNTEELSRSFEKAISS